MREAWAKFFLLAKCILFNPPRGGRCHWRDTQKRIQARIARWKEGEFSRLWEEAVQASTHSSRRLRRHHASPPPISLGLPMPDGPAASSRTASIVKLSCPSPPQASPSPPTKCWTRCWSSTLNQSLPLLLPFQPHPQSRWPLRTSSRPSAHSLLVLPQAHHPSELIM